MAASVAPAVATVASPPAVAAPPPASIPVLPPGPTNDLEVVSHDPAVELAVFRSGPVENDSAVVDVVAVVGGLRQRDRLDLTAHVPAQPDAWHFRSH